MSHPDLTSGTFQQRLFSKIDFNAPGGCWLWTAGTQSDGYGSIKGNGADGRKYLAHRAVFLIMVGDIPDGLQVDHRCHVLRCVNPDHLRLATNAENRQHLRGAQRNNLSSGVRGVSRHKKTGKWQANVTHNQRQQYLGLFDTVEEAAAAARDARLRLFTFNDKDRECTTSPTTAS